MSVWRGPLENVAYEFVLTFPSCLIHLIWMVLEMESQWPYSCCFVGCCSQDLFNIAHSILVQLPSNFFSICIVSVHVVHQYSSIETTTAWKKLHFILLDSFDFYMIKKLLITIYAFASCILISFSVEEMLLLRYVNLSIDFRESAFRVEMSPFWLKDMFYILSAFTWRPMPPAACSRLYSRDSAWVAIFARSAMLSL